MNSEGKEIGIGMKIENNLYKLRFKTRKTNQHILNKDVKKCEMFNLENISHSWETWHKHYGNIGYPGLQKLIDNKMVEHLNVDVNSSKPDCEICVQAKQTIKPFDGVSNWKSEPGEITHIDLWGKYDIASTTEIIIISYSLMMPQGISKSTS